MMSNQKTQQKIVIYTAQNGEVDLKVQMKDETVWLRQNQIAELFGKDRTVVTRHINNILKDGEVDEKSNVQKMHIANSDKPVTFYSLDIILSVGYRTSSSNAIAFRKWSTGILKQHITKGYTINPHMISKNYETFLRAVEDVKKLAKGNEAIRPAKYRFAVVNVKELIWA